MFFSIPMHFVFKEGSESMAVIRDAESRPIIIGQQATVTIDCGAQYTGAVLHVRPDMITVRCGVTGDNSDGILFSVAPSRARILSD